MRSSRQKHSAPTRQGSHMATVTKEIADAIARGEYEDDDPKRIVVYTNAWGGKAYGVTFGREDPDKYLRASEYVREPEIYWEHP